MTMKVTCPRCEQRLTWEWDTAIECEGCHALVGIKWEEDFDGDILIYRVWVMA